MEQLIIHGGCQLNGTVEIEGAKNSVLPLLASSLLVTDNVTVLKNVPLISDVFTMIEILRSLNVKVDINEQLKELKIDATEPLNAEADSEYVKQIRASVLIVGSLLTRNGWAKITSIGGCAIGRRAIDLHLKGFQELGAKIIKNSEFVEIAVNEFIGTTVYLDFPSVGATCNIINAAVTAKCETLIENAAKEPEIVELANFLNKMGAKIKGAGTATIQIKGVNGLVGCEYTVMQDRIEAGTFMIAAAMTKGDVFIKDAVKDHNLALIQVLQQIGAKIYKKEGGIRVIGSKINSTVVTTAPYPGFSTDLQAPLSALLMISNGSSVIIENVYEDRFQHLAEMKRMNGNVLVNGNVAVINGSGHIHGADVSATDLRAAASLVLLGLCANGITRVSNLEYLDRGYHNFHLKLTKLGAKVKRIVKEV